METIRASARILEERPQLGRPAQDLPDGFREWIIAYGSSGYVALYHVEDECVALLALRHQREAGYYSGAERS